MAKGQIKQKQATIKKSEFEELCKIQCTETEIAGVFGVCRDTLIDWCKDTYGKSFSTVYEEKREGGKASLRRSQWKIAESNPTMAIFLGKQYLGQTDKQETNIDIKSNRIQIVNDLVKEE